MTPGSPAAPWSPAQLAHFKQQAGEAAAAEVRSGMVIGLGVGSTAIFALRRLSLLLQSGALRNVLAVPCSLAVEQVARQLGFPLTTLEEHPALDLTIDGADEIDPAWNLIKGGGGALLREKIVAQASRRELIVADETKLSPVLGTICPLPVEVLPFGWRTQQAFLESLGARVQLRTPSAQAGGSPYYTDQGNFILDCSFGPISDPDALAPLLSAHAGILAHGLFLRLANELIIAGPSGLRRVAALDRAGPAPAR